MARIALYRTFESGILFSGLEKKLDGLDRQKNHELYFQTVQATQERRARKS